MVPLWGFFGAAFTLLIAYLVYLVLSDIISKRYFDAKWERIKVYSYLLLSLLIALIAPVFEIKLGIRLHWILKIILGGVGLTLPFVFGLLTMAQISEAWSMIKKIRK